MYVSANFTMSSAMYEQKSIPIDDNGVSMETRSFGAWFGEQNACTLFVEK